MIRDLIHEPEELTLPTELDAIKIALHPKTPIAWLITAIKEELWEEEEFQGGDIPTPPGLRTLWDTLSHHLGHQQTISETTIRLDDSSNGASQCLKLR